MKNHPEHSNMNVGRVHRDTLTGQVTITVIPPEGTAEVSEGAEFCTFLTTYDLEAI